MIRGSLSILFLAMVANPGFSQWTQWRGSADGQGIIEGVAPVTEWSETHNIIWKSSISGIGSSSPVVTGGKVFITSADEKRGKFFLICYDQKSGEKLWEKQVFWGEVLDNLHKQNTHAPATVATDGEILSVVFGVDKAVWIAAYDLDGKKLWDKEIVKVKSNFGIGSSPMVYKDMVVVLSDMEPEPLIVAYRLKDGKQLWKTRRNDKGDADFHSYSTPRVYKVDGKDQIVTTGLGKVKFYDPETGKLIWDIEAGADATVGTPLLDRRYLYVNGGYPQNGTFAVDLRRQEVIWQNRFPSYIVSMVFHDHHIYGSTNRGEFACMDAKSGVILWRERFREDVQSSPFVAGGKIYLILQNGTTKVIKPDPSEYIELASNVLPGRTDATPAILDGLMYYRTEDALYCIGEG